MYSFLPAFISFQVQYNNIPTSVLFSYYTAFLLLCDKSIAIQSPLYRNDAYILSCV